MVAVAIVAFFPHIENGALSGCLNAVFVVLDSADVDDWRFTHESRVTASATSSTLAQRAHQEHLDSLVAAGAR